VYACGVSSSNMHVDGCLYSAVSSNRRCQALAQRSAESAVTTGYSAARINPAFMHQLLLMFVSDTRHNRWHVSRHMNAGGVAVAIFFL
jgi:hypothetical protein